MQNNTATYLLSTRPLDEQIKEAAASRGFKVDESSFITTEPITDVATLAEIEEVLLLQTTVIFTSMNAVQAVADQLEGVMPQWDIYCMGNTTRELVAEYFGEDAIVGTAINAASLAEVIIENGNTDEVIFFCGDQRREELPERLEANGIAVREIVVYSTIPTPHKLTRDYAGILFYSPSAVQSFFTVNKLNESTVYFAIGTTTAAALHSFVPSHQVITANVPGKEALVDEAIAFFS